MWRMTILPIFIRPNPRLVELTGVRVKIPVKIRSKLDQKIKKHLRIFTFRRFAAQEIQIAGWQKVCERRSQEAAVHRGET